MPKYTVTPTNTEHFLGENEIIVSKTDLKGRITYANRIFLDIAGYTEEEVLGAPHSILRHPDMPRCVFKLLWDRIGAGHEIFAYVKNMTKIGDFYWVFAHVTPSRDSTGNIIGYHSNRRAPARKAVEDIATLYRSLLAEEAKHADKKAGLEAGTAALNALLAGRGLDYDAFIFEFTEGAMAA